MEGIYKTYCSSPIGIIEINGTEQAVHSIIFVEKSEKVGYVPWILKECASQLDEYFSGKRKEFSLNYILEGTEFQKKVWNELSRIPYGETVSYRYIAESIGNTKAVRAVGSANSKNPLSIIIPCHRVIGINGTLTGYAGGLWRKDWLINHEKSL